jgi:excisionase family DNA binding protein
VTDTQAAETAWLTTPEAARLIGAGTSTVVKRIVKGDLPAERDEHDHYRIRRADVLALWEVPEAPPAVDPPPLGAVLLRELAARGGEFSDPSGRAAAMITDAVEQRHGYNRQSISTTYRTLDTQGLIEREVDGKRTKRIALTPAGRAWLQANPVEPDDEPTPEPSLELGQPEESPDPPADALVRVAATITGEASPVAPRRTNGYGPQLPAVERPTAVEPDAIAHALLRQAVRVLNDSDVITLSAERDSLRVHNQSLAARLDEATRRAEAAEAEAREVRAVLHGIEMQLTPMLAGPDATFGWLDARTRTELMTLVGEAARWAAS